MLIPDVVLDYLAKEYDRACIDPTRLPFVTWAAIQARKMGWEI